VRTDNENYEFLCTDIGSYSSTEKTCQE